MLENGHQILGCRVDGLLSSNAVYDTYGATASDSTAQRLLEFKAQAFADATQRQVAVTRANTLAAQHFADIGLPLKAEEFEDRVVCLLPERMTTLQDQFQGRYPQAEALTLVRRIAIALSVPHASGFSHGTLSPQSVCPLSETPVLADFALSTLSKLDFDSGIDPHFVSPEQVRGEEQSSASDIYSLGCLLHLMLSGTPPFADSDNLFVALQRQDQDFPSLPDDVLVCQSLVNKLVALQPDERPNVEQLVAEIDALLSSDIEESVVPVPLSVEPDSSSNEDTSVADENSSALLAAKIEARLQELEQADLPPAEQDKPYELPAADVSEPFVAADPRSQRKSSSARHLLLLLLGIVIGIVVYALVFDHQQVVDSNVADTSRRLTIADMELGVELWRQGEYDSSAAEFLRLNGMSPDDPRPYNNLAAVYVSMGDYERARKTLEQALGTNNDYVTVYHNLAAVYAEMARNSYGKALQLGELKLGLELEVFSNNIDAPIVAASLPDVSDLGAEVDVLDLDRVSGPEPVADLAVSVAVQREEVVVALQEQPLEQSEKSDSDAAVDVLAATATATQQPGSQSVESVRETVTATLGQEPEMLEIQKVLNGWAAAWSGQDVEGYLDYYADDFLPSSGASIERWKQQRRNRLSKPSAIEVTLDNIVLVEKTADSLLVDAEQGYKSDVYSDLTRKRFELRSDGDGYRIVRERALEVIQ